MSETSALEGSMQQLLEAFEKTTTDSVEPVNRVFDRNVSLRVPGMIESPPTQHDQMQEDFKVLDQNNQRFSTSEL